ncbi:MAG: DNA replication and repair protein RecF, partial [Acidimicrobiia bacterium]|nr:DNA replication and repair protein RecF [Acidimicrobiia bacterium]
VLRSELSHPAGTSLIEVEIPREGRRRMQVNRNRVGRTADLAEHLRAVVFQPDDLDVVKRSPSYRRAFLDEAAVQLWPVAHQDLGEYERAVRQRNALLKQMGRRTDRPTLEVWNQRVAVAGARVMARRAATMDALAEPAVRAYAALAGGSVAISFAYQSSWGSSPADAGGVAEWEARLWEALEASSVEDMERRVTTVGPHRDDPALRIDGRDTRTRASQGEQRSLVLALRLAQQEAISARLGHPAVMLLDDVFSELDGARAAALASALPPGQAFISTARDEEVPLEGRRWSVRPGSVA